MKQREILHTYQSKTMSDVTVQGLMSASRKNLRSKIEREHAQQNDLQTLSFITQDKKGRCYTYRGVSYCYQ